MSVVCELCGNPMPPGEEMFKFHGYSGPCPVTSAGREPLDRDAMQRVIDEVAEERAAQHSTWGQQDMTDGEWLAVLTEEVGEAATAILRSRSATPAMHRRTDTLRAEMVQVAAVAVAWVEALDRRAGHA